MDQHSSVTEIITPLFYNSGTVPQKHLLAEYYIRRMVKQRIKT